MGIGEINFHLMPNQVGHYLIVVGGGLRPRVVMTSFMIMLMP